MSSEPPRLPPGPQAAGTDQPPGRVLAGVQISLAPFHRPPFPIEALVLEEDTYLVLSARPEVREPAEHRLRTLTESFLAQPKEPGSVIVRTGEPIRFLAVVHDLAAEPTWREKWVREALRQCFERAGRFAVRNLGLPILGGLHGQVDVATFARLLHEELGDLAPESLERIWLITPSELETEMRRQLWRE